VHNPSTWAITKIVKTNLRIVLGIWILASFALLSSCAHRYYFVPEVEGDGARYGGNGVILMIPPSQPEFKLKLVSFGPVPAPKQANLPSGTKMFELRMYLGASTTAGVIKSASIDPKEQALLLPDFPEIRPTLIHTSVSAKKVLKVQGPKPRVIELFFPLPEHWKLSEAQWFSVRWKLRYGNDEIAEQQTRFDRRDRGVEGGGEIPGDPYYSDMDQAIIPPEFLGDGEWWGPVF
jgi:hypothetical protein